MKIYDLYNLKLKSLMRLVEYVEDNEDSNVQLKTKTTTKGA